MGTKGHTRAADWKASEGGMRRMLTVLMAATAAVFTLLVILASPSTAAVGSLRGSPVLVVQSFADQLIPGRILDPVATYTVIGPRDVHAEIYLIGDRTASTLEHGLRAAQQGAERLPRWQADSPTRRMMEKVAMVQGQDGQIMWDGLLQDGNCAPGGTYVIKLIATDAAGKKTQALPLIVHVVETE